MNSQLYHNKQFIDLLFRRYQYYKRNFLHLQEYIDTIHCSNNCIYKHTMSNYKNSFNYYREFYLNKYKTTNIKFNNINKALSDPIISTRRVRLTTIPTNIFPDDTNTNIDYSFCSDESDSDSITTTETDYSNEAKIIDIELFCLPSLPPSPILDNSEDEN